MTTPQWTWKNKDGNGPGLLYESGNWGDLLKAAWLSAVIRWKGQKTSAVSYFDPFAGDVAYPLSRKAAFRLSLSDLSELEFLREPFLEKGQWPSAASAAILLAGGKVEVWDADAGRREHWRACPGVVIPEGASGWELLAAHEPDPEAIWLIDPYDFLAEWREYLDLLLEKAASTTTLLYLYNRSGRSREIFAAYRAFRNALEDAWPWPKRLGRVAADPFLPQSHHEMLLLPGSRDRERSDLETLFETLLAGTMAINVGVRAAENFDC